MIYIHFFLKVKLLTRFFLKKNHTLIKIHVTRILRVELFLITKKKKWHKGL